MAEARGFAARAIRSSLRTLGEPETRQMIVDALAMPEVRDASRQLVANATDGALDALGEDARAARIDALLDDLVGRLATSLSARLEQELVPTLTQSATRAIRDEIAPAARAMVHDELAPMLRAALDDPETNAAVATLARDLGRKITLGATEAMEEVNVRRHEKAEEVRLGNAPDRRLPIVQNLERLTSRASIAILMLKVGLAAGGITLLGWAIHLATR